MSEDKKSREFLLTYNNPEITPAQFIEHIKKMGAKKLIFQLEKGEKTGTPHYQGYIYFPNPRYEKAVNKGQKFHVEIAKNPFAVKAYVEKEETKEDGPWGFGYKKFIEDEYANVPVIENLYDWQAELVKKFDEDPDDRSIHWYYSTQGNVGKTSFAKYLCVKKEALFVSGKANDVKCAIALLKKNNKPIPKIIIFHFTRTNENFVSYEAIESVKDGIFFSGKYESGMIIYPPPHVLCLANFAPVEQNLSIDRWVIKKID